MADSAKVARMSMTRLGELLLDGGALFLFGFAAVMSVVVEAIYPRYVLWISAGQVVAAVSLLYPLAVGGGRLERFRAWLQEQPFTFPDLMDALGNDQHRRSGAYTSGRAATLTLTVVFVGDAEVGDDIVETMKAYRAWQLSKQRDRVSARLVDFGNSAGNYSLYRLMKELVPRLLLPLHQRRAIAGVTVAWSRK